ncbi:MAG TPA: ABC transporter substrate-binding protein [Candidatus Eisenbacteria bacterium]|jgi:branched-chain amino acid transport system substrate-binding protein
MTSRTRLRLGVAAILAVAAWLAVGCGGSTTDELVIGEYGSLTGNDATFGQSTKNGVQVALDELMARAAGKIGGLRVRVVVEDDQGRAEEAATVVQKLINQDRVIAVLGEVASSRSLAGAPICQSAGVPMISPSSTNPRVTQVGDDIFRMCFLDDFQGRVMARFAAENLKLKKVAILKDVRNDYSVGLTQYFTEGFAALGGTVVVEQSYSSGDQDFRAQLTAIKAKKPEGIVVPGYYTEAGLIARQARELGIQVPLIGGDGWESQQLIQIGGEALNGCYYSNHWALDQPDPKLQAFLKKYREKFSLDPDAIGGLAYDAANVLFGALESMAKEDPETFRGLGSSKAGSDARKAATAKLRDRIAATAGYSGVTGTITLDANRNASKPAVVIEIRDGQKKYDTTISPSSPS